MIALETKVCSICNEAKAIANFTLCRGYPQGRCKSCNAEYARNWRAKNRERHDEIVRASQLRKFGLTPDEYDELLRRQNNVCAICEQQCSSGRRLAVDHDHATDRVRGLLCRRCNTTLGLLGERVATFERIIEYLNEALN